MITAYVAIGSNLGDREGHVAYAFRALQTLPQTALRRRSRVYETEPVGPGVQDRYLNAVAELDTALAARALLDALLAIETRAGRVRRERWGPRTLDLDLLLYGDEHIDEPDLVVPHPRMTERVFVMVPLAELIGERVVAGRRLGERAAALETQSELRVWNTRFHRPEIEL